MAAPNSFSNLKTNVGRSVTKKWREANQISYDGDDWGDEDEYEEQPPVPADVGGHSQWAASHPGFHRSNRSVTNPSPSRIVGRASFDHGDDRRAFSAGFDSAYPTTQRSPFPEPQHDDELSSPGHRGQPPLRLNTQPQGPMSPGNFRPGSRGRQYPQYDAPFSAPGGFPQQRRSGSSNRPPPGDIYQRHDSPMRPDSRGSSASVRQFPPRKASLSQQQPPQMPFTQDVDSANPVQFEESNNNDDKPVPVFVRPSDIYKRMPEEMEKVRKSQESSRPSLDSILGRSRASSAGARSTSSEYRDVTTAASQPFEDPDSARRLKPTLDPVPERKSEYVFDNIVQASQALESESRMNPEPGDGAGDAGASVSRHGTTASSVYTDRPDPVSASSVSRNVSLSENIPEADHDRTSAVRPTLALPAIGRVSGFGMDFGASTPEFQSGVQSSAEPELPTSQEANLEPNIHGLQHQQSFGYRSMVQQAFDESQNQDSYSPVSPSATVDRSNSASTADISPIITRKQEHSSTVSDYEPTHPTIPEESLPTNSRPTSTATLRPREAQYDEDELSPPPTIRTGYRREATPPSPDNSPAKRPLSIELPAAAQPQRGDMGFEQEQEPTEESSAQERTFLEVAAERPLPSTPGADFRGSSPYPESSPPSPTQTRSQIQQEWQAQREQLSDQHGASNSNSQAADLPSPIKRSETPARGTVRDLAGKLETLSGRSTPNNLQGSSPDQGRPPAQPRLESFRPAIPGGWQSFTSVAESSAQGSTSTPLQPSSDLSQIQHRPPFAPTHVESTESIPTAKAPENHGGAEPDIITQKAFAAAASAGNALAKSFTGHRPIPEPDASGGASEDSSENEWDASSNSSKQDVDRVIVRDQAQEQTQGPPSAKTAEPAGRSSPTYPSEDKRTHLDVSPVSPHDGDQQDPDAADSHADSYFPAPLRTARLSATVSRPPIPEVTVQEGSPSENDNERLELEIEKSLTPRSSDLTGANDSQPAQTEPTNTDGKAPSFADPRSPPPPLSSETRGVPRKESSFNSELGAIVGGAPSIAAPTTDGAMVSSKDRVLPQQEPSRTTHDDGGLAASAPATRSLDEPPVGKDGRPFLQQRFSWETQIEPEPPISTPKQTTPPPTSPPQTIRATSQPDSRTVDTNDLDINVRQSVDFARQSVDFDSDIQDQLVLSTERFSSGTKHDIQEPQPPPKPLQSEPLSFRATMSLATPQERIQAFDETRRVLALPDGQLEEWLLSLKSGEHSELFAMNGRLPPEIAESVASHKPSPRRIFTESTGTRHMQEDGKKLMAAAGRFGGKAGIAAKGLFAKGKEKMRQASSGEKGQRKSTGPELERTLEEEPPPMSQARNATFREEPPRIPLTISPISSTTDWFPRPELLRSQTSERRGPLQPEGEASSQTSVNQATDRRPSLGQSTERQLSEEPPVRVLPPAEPSSPTVSALDSEWPENAGVLSRSISQLTGPMAGNSPTEPHQRDHGSSQTELKPTLSQIQKATVRQNPIGEQTSAAAAAASQADTRPNGSRLDVLSGDRGLRVQHDRPHSIVSDVSSIGPVPENTAGIHTTRSISPADASPGVSETNQIEKSTSSPQGFESSNVAGSEPPTVTAVGQDARPSLEQLPPPPGIDEPYITPEEVGMHVETTAPRGSLEKDAQSQTQQEQVLDTDRTRPFSFAGPEGIAQTHGFPQAEADPSRVSAQLSPTTRTLSSQSWTKEAAKGDVRGQSNVLAHRQSRSYSRPFGADPAATNESPLRSGELVQPPGDRMQNPLPSARRPQDGGERMHYQRQDQQFEDNSPQMESRSAAEEGYRIPGPYVQEYRSPKHISTPKSARSQTQVLASGEPLPSALRAQHHTGQSSRPVGPGSTSYAPGEQRLSRSYQIPTDTAAARGHLGSRDVQYQYEVKPKALHQEQIQPTGRQSMSLPPPQSMSDSDHQRQSLVYPPPQRQSMGPPPVPTQPQPQPPVTSSPATKRPKKGFFGALFGSSSSARSKLQKDVGPDQSGSGHHKEKRNSLFRRNSRHDSISSQQSSLYHTGQDQPSNLQSQSQDPSRSNKRQSTELLRTPTPETAKRKRFSGLGNRLFKTSSHSKMEATSAEHASIVDSNTAAQREPGQQLSSRPVMSPLTYHPSSQQAAYDQYDSGYGPYPHPRSGVVQGDPGQDRWRQYPPRNVQRQHPESPNMNIVSPYHQQTTRPISYPYPSGDASQHRHVQGLRQPERRPYASTPSPYADPSDGNSRPADLRIDTGAGGGGGRGTLNNNGGTGYVLPATAPAQIYPTGSSFSAGADPGHAAPSYTSGSLSPSVPTGTMPMATSGNDNNDNIGVGVVAAPHSSTPVAAAYHQPYGSRQQKPRVQNDQRAYVLNLHKRSRSPRLGRKTSSDEDLNVTAGRVRQASPGSSSPHVEKLGTFSSKKISPVGGIPRAEDDQERPFAINVPGLDNDENDESDPTRGIHAGDNHIEEGRNHEEGSMNRNRGVGVETSITQDDQVQLPLQNPDRDRDDGFEESHPSDNMVDKRGAPFQAQVTRTETETPVSEREHEEEEESRLYRASAGHGGVQVSGVAQRDTAGAGAGVGATATSAAAAAIGSGGSQGGGGDDGNISPSLPQGHDRRPMSVSLSEELKAQLEREQHDHNRRESGTARDHVRDVTAGGVLAELPGSGYESDSEEEIRMSATAYPGQEWVPVVVDVGDGRWDD
ncbi:hypothetical protein ABEF95_010765 [Exophiala dermatitidis]